MNPFEIIGALAGVVVAVVQGANYVVLMQTKTEISQLKIYMLEKFVTKENAREEIKNLRDQQNANLQQMWETAERIIDAVRH